MATLAEQINKIKSAKADLATAIKAKGGALADGAKLADFDEAVEQIKVGGGSSSIVKSRVLWGR
jgi:hypothetical protein